MVWYQVQYQLQSLLFPFLLIAAFFIFSLFTLRFYRDEEKVDKGVMLNYFRLSHRRKMIRGLTTLPVTITALVIIYQYSNWSTSVYIAFVLCIVFLMGVDMFYHYLMWKKEQEQE